MSFEVNYEEDLVSRIRDLIDGYSKNSILKEYLQNADDSNATELIVTFDKRRHSSLTDSKFEVASGPSLLLFNNSQFKEKDFKSIVKISAQGKVDDPNSTGRFGQGFSSSFSICDHPTFISNGRAYWFDVLKSAVAKGNNKSIQGWDLEQDNKEIFEWLTTFNLDNENPGTTFRLPLRHKNTARLGKISHEEFTFDDFLSWCDEWKNNSSGLLFLRHIQKLTLQEVNENNEKIIHVEISTENAKEIHDISNQIQNEFSGGLLDICSGWKNRTEELPLCIYKHHFKIKHFDRIKQVVHEIKESWAVVNGLFRGKNDVLIEQAIKVLSILPNPRKVLPWAGVAIRLDEKGNVKKLSDSGYYTFLPLPIKSKHPVNIHGWFDLNPKRTEITFDGSGNDKEILIEWNQLLFKEAIGCAWAYLIDYIKLNCSSTIYYSLWPKNNDDEFDDYLLEGFYNTIGGLDCLKTQYQKETIWNKPSDEIYYIPKATKNLFAAIKEHFSIISPKPPSNVINGFSEIEAELEIISPQQVRDYLTEEADNIEFPVDFNCIPIKMISKLEWLKSILIYCAEADEDQDFSYLNSLPLELTIDNKVNTISDHRLLDSCPRLSVFEQDKSLFIHPEIIEIVKNAEELPPSWLVPSLNNYLTVLNENIESYDRKKKRWLKHVISMIVNANEVEILEAIEQLHELEIVYQHNFEFAKLQIDNDSPFLVKESDTSNSFPLLDAGINTVHPEYIDIYNPILKWNKHALIKELNSYTLAKYLLLVPVEEYQFFNQKLIREYLIDILVQDLSWMEDLSSNEKKHLNEIPFVATERGNVYSKSEDVKLYLPTGFAPPKHINNLKGEFEIISTNDDKDHRMYSKMGFEEQTPKNYLKQVILPFIGNSSLVADVIKISEWLANNWEILVKNLSDDEENELVSSLSSAHFVIDSECNLNLASNYYHPSFFATLPGTIQDKKYSPYKFENPETQSNWLDLLSKIGISNTIIPGHIVNVVNSIVAEENVVKSVDLINFISNFFEIFEDMKFENKNIFIYLSKLAWVPSEGVRGRVLCPEEKYQKLRTPNELILGRDYKKAGGAHYCVSSKIKLGKKDIDGEYSEKQMAEKIGILATPPTSSMLKSFRRLIHLNNSGKSYDKRVTEYAKEFYKYVGLNNVYESQIPEDIKEKSIFIKGNWLPSSSVFQQLIQLSGIYSWDELIVNDGKESRLAEGLIKLGVSERPDNEYLVSFLRGLPQNEKLEKQNLKDAKAILIELQTSLSAIDYDKVLLLSRTNKLLTSESLYIKDLASYDNSDRKNEQIDFCHQQFERLARKCDVVSLADKIAPIIDTEQSKNSSEGPGIWGEAIHSEPFKSSILRLIYHEGKIDEGDINHDAIESVLPSELFLMDSIVVKYFVGDIWVYDNLHATTFQDNTNSSLYLLNQEDEEDMCESIATFITDPSGLSRSSYSLISRILRNKIFTLEDINYLLDSKNIKSLPEAIIVDDNISLYGEIEDESLDDDYSFASDLEKKLSETDFLSDSEKLEFQNTDLAPPINPKSAKPSDSNNKSSNGSGGCSSNRSFTNNQGSMASQNTNNDSLSNKAPNRSSTPSQNPNKIVSPNIRKPVYVGKEKEIESESTQDKKDFATEVGNKGEDYIINHSSDYILSKSNRLEKAPVNNKGFDIRELNSDGTVVRYIEVKTLTGVWAEGGVAVTESQLEFAQVNDEWWLFVVENINSNNPSVYIFENPVQEANRFMFDHSWKQLSKTAEKVQEKIPEHGDRYKFSDGIYEICKVDTKGKLYKVTLEEVASGKKLIKQYNPTWEKC
jgi:hypothetical protein